MSAKLRFLCYILISWQTMLFSLRDYFPAIKRGWQKETKIKSLICVLFIH